MNGSSKAIKISHDITIEIAKNAIIIKFLSIFGLAYAGSSLSFIHKYIRQENSYYVDWSMVLTVVLCTNYLFIFLNF